MTDHLLKYRFYYFSVLLLLAGFLIRGLIYSPGLEYDEIWTVQHYSTGSLQKIFTDLATPNNHPLNSLLIKCTSYFSSSVFSLRLSAFLFGLLTIPLTGLLAFRLFRSRVAALGAMSFTAFNAGLILYSITGRGYSLQVFLIAGYALSVVRYAETYRKRYLPLIFLTGILSILTLPTSVLWLFPISLTHCVFEIFRCRKEWKKTVPEFLVYLLTGACVLFWLLYNYKAFRAGQSFGQELSSFSGFFHFAGSSILKISGICCAILVGLSVPLLFIVKRKRRYILLSLLFIVVFPFAAAFFTMMGPPRVYLASVPFLALSAGFVIAEGILRLKRKKYLLLLAFVAVLLFSFVDYRWSGPEWSRCDWMVRFSIYKDYEPEYFFCISPTASYPAVWNNADSLSDYLKRFAAFGTNSYFVCMDSVGALSGLEQKNDSEESFPISFKVNESQVSDMHFSTYQVVPFASVPNAELLLLKLNHFDPLEYFRLYRFLGELPCVEKMLLVNSFFVSNIQRTREDQRLYLILACKLKADAGKNETFQRFYQLNQKRFGFYTLRRD